MVKTYQQRMVMKPTLQLTVAAGSCAIRMLSGTKTCATDLELLAQAVVAFAWADGPWVVGHSMPSLFPSCSTLSKTTHEE